jgi:hypothetical protein
MPNLSGDDALLEKSLKTLEQAWAISGERWQDAAREDFERQHLDPIMERARVAVRALKQLDGLLAETMRQCR